MIGLRRKKFQIYITKGIALGYRCVSTPFKERQMTRCPYCGATPLSPPRVQARQQACQTGAKLGAALGAIKGRTGMAIGSVAGAIIGGLLATQRWWPISGMDFCQACQRELPDEP